MINGLAARFAHALGLQTDGEQFGLSPFQSEIRRRVWWEFIGRDRRAHENYGVLSFTDTLRTAHPSVPLNVEDVDLYPEMSALPSPRESWTEMTNSVTQTQILLTMQKIALLSKSQPAPRETQRLQVMTEAKMVIDRYLQYCDPVVPRQRLVLAGTVFTFRKLDFITRIHWRLMFSENPVEAFRDEKDLLEAMDLLETSHAMRKDLLLTPYMIPSMAYPQYHLGLYLLWRLRENPTTGSFGRAWEAISTMLEDEDAFAFAGVDPKLVILKSMAAKAREVHANATFDHSQNELCEEVPVSDYRNWQEEQQQLNDDNTWAFPFESFAQAADLGLDWFSIMGAAPGTDSQIITCHGLSS
jgi:hypothetical protein